HTHPHTHPHTHTHTHTHSLSLSTPPWTHTHTHTLSLYQHLTVHTHTHTHRKYYKYTQSPIVLHVLPTPAHSESAVSKVSPAPRASGLWRSELDEPSEDHSSSVCVGRGDGLQREREREEGRV